MGEEVSYGHVEMSTDTHRQEDQEEEEEEEDENKILLYKIRSRIDRQIITN